MGSKFVVASVGNTGSLAFGDKTTVLPQIRTTAPVVLLVEDRGNNRSSAFAGMEYAQRPGPDRAIHGDEGGAAVAGSAHRPLSRGVLARGSHSGTDLLVRDSLLLQRCWTLPLLLAPTVGGKFESQQYKN